jgi:hypothetical protein
MDHHSIVQFLHLPELDATKIQHELEAVLGLDVMSCSTVACAFGDETWTDSETPHSEIDDPIVQAHSDVPLASVKWLARGLFCAPMIVYCYFKGPLHSVYKYLQWISYDLIRSQKFFELRSQPSFFDSSYRSDTTTQHCSSHWMSAGFLFAKTSNDSGFSGMNPRPVRSEA